MLQHVQNIFFLGDDDIRIHLWMGGCIGEQHVHQVALGQHIILHDGTFICPQLFHKQGGHHTGAVLSGSAEIHGPCRSGEQNIQNSGHSSIYHAPVGFMEMCPGSGCIPAAGNGQVMVSEKRIYSQRTGLALHFFFRAQIHQGGDAVFQQPADFRIGQLQRDIAAQKSLFGHRQEAGVQCGLEQGCHQITFLGKNCVHCIME